MFSHKLTFCHLLTFWSTNWTKSIDQLWLLTTHHVNPFHFSMSPKVNCHVCLIKPCHGIIMLTLVLQMTFFHFWNWSNIWDLSENFCIKHSYIHAWFEVRKTRGWFEFSIKCGSHYITSPKKLTFQWIIFTLACYTTTYWLTLRIEKLWPICLSWQPPPFFTLHIHPFEFHSMSTLQVLYQVRIIFKSIKQKDSNWSGKASH